MGTKQRAKPRMGKGMRLGGPPGKPPVGAPAADGGNRGGWDAIL